MADDTLTEEDRSAEPDVAPAAKGARTSENPDDPDLPAAARGMGGVTDRGLAESFADIKAKQARIGELYQKRNEALAPRYDAMQRSLAAQDEDPALASPQFTPQPPAPKQRQGELLQSVGPFLAAMAVMSAAGFGSHHLRETLAATNGMLQGAQQGAKEVVEENQKIWEMESKAVTEENRQKLAAYQAAYQKYRGDFQRQMEALKIEAAKFDDEIAYLTASQGDSVKFGEYMMKLKRATDNYEASHQRLLLQQERTKTEHEKLLRAQQGGDKPFTMNQPEGIRQLAKDMVEKIAPQYANDEGLVGVVTDYITRLRSTGNIPDKGGVQGIINQYLTDQRKAKKGIGEQMQDVPGGSYPWSSGPKPGAGKDPKNPIIIKSNEELQAIPHGKGTIYYKWFDEPTVYKIQ